MCCVLVVRFFVECEMKYKSFVIWVFVILLFKYFVEYGYGRGNFWRCFGEELGGNCVMFVVRLYVFVWLFL